MSNHHNDAASDQHQLSPSQRYAAARQRQAHMKSAAFRFTQTLPFALDDFQLQAMNALEDGNNVLVAAPTGAGKTVIADFAVFLAQERNVKAFYTTPIKALSNQKYHDLVEVFGEHRVGLLTGDTSINSEADIVVMTTEVLRNMLYEQSSTLHALRYVVLDEVHFLADRYRGPVWEEVIIHLPQSVRIIGLSATVSNVEDFSSWIESVRGTTTLIVSERRPVPLEQHVIVQAGDSDEPELFDLYRRNAAQQSTLKLNPELVNRLEQLDRNAHRRENPRKRSRFQSRHPHTASPRSGVDRHIPRRWAVVDELDYLGMLPGIYFIFSRNGCDQAVEQCLNAGLELTSDNEARKIRRIVDEMVDGQLSRDDLKALHFSRFRFALEEGFASHHAGMVALFRHIVERLFDEGLIKVVFATETLALGINMPARSVVVEKLEKFDGTGHVALTPGEFTQLTGRAGRRGIDTLGHAVVVDHKGFVPSTAAALSSKRVYPLHSSFKPTFNMAVNLLNTSDYESSRITLDHSFAQWEANESAWQLESEMNTLRAALQGYEDAFKCEYGDFKEFMTLRMQLSDAQKNGRRELKHQLFSSQQERSRAFQQLDKRIATLKEQEKEHPCRSCPDLQTHLKWGHRWAREQRELDRISRRFDSRTGSVARRFDKICGILQELGYLTQKQQSSASTPTTSPSQTVDFLLTVRGQLLRRIYSEQDLILAQILLSDTLRELDPQELAAVLSSMVYESRRGEGGAPRQYPGGPEGVLMHSVEAMTQIWAQVNTLCEDNGLEPSQSLDFGICDIMYQWAGGEELSSILHDREMTGGDFVRNAKRLADILSQIAQVGAYLPESNSELSHTAIVAADLINRGIVAYSGVD
ncbi:MAG: DEAD/DEAH box helicase [Bifidobacterium sp.]|jgi:ATP-dependent RNA helicase HelY|nr:DEAD/DEAH box helicase [Bifidobacterium sp.]